MNILNEIAQKTKERIEEQKKEIPLEEMKREAFATCQSFQARKPHAFLEALSGAELSFICEVKKASPSKGIIAQDFPWLQIAKDYEAAGAAAISCLTEPYWFLGKDEYLQEIAKTVSIPVLRKDFTVDEYMIYQAKVLGADAVLLIVGILSDAQVKEYRLLAESLGMDALVEAYTEEELNRAARSGARIIGVNNRNLKDFSVDTANSQKLKKQAPEGTIFVSESGITTAEQVAQLRANGTNAVLIGESLMRAKDKKAMLEYLAGKR